MEKLIKKEEEKLNLTFFSLIACDCLLMTLNADL